MAIIKMTVGDLLRGKILDAGWYSFQVAKLEKKQSKDKQSINFEYTLVLIDKTPELNGKEIINRYNSKAISMMIPFWAASQGQSVQELPLKDFDMDDDLPVGTKVDGKVIVETYEGQLKNDFETFLPYKRSQDTPSFVG